MRMFSGWRRVEVEIIMVWISGIRWRWRWWSIEGWITGGLDHWCPSEMLKDIFDFLRQKFGMVEEAKSRNKFIRTFCLLFDFSYKKGRMN
jgi:hypothetical protein